LAPAEALVLVLVPARAEALVPELVQELVLDPDLGLVLALALVLVLDPDLGLALGPESDLALVEAQEWGLDNSCSTDNWPQYHECRLE